MTSKTTNIKDTILKTGRRLGRPDILFWTLPYLMILIFVGTIAQKEIGLYEAQKMFFSSFGFWWMGIPLPSGYSVLGLMTLNLVCKFLFLSPWTRAKIGIHIIHLSIIILFIGGLLTALTMKEGFIALSENETGNVIADYNKRVLTIGDNYAVSFYDLEQGNLGQTPFDIEITQTCRNTAIRPRTNLESPDNDGIGAASMAELLCIPDNVENERNIASVTYRANDGTYIAFEGRQTQDTINDMVVKLDREEREIPFDITLNRFQRDVYPGSNMPREFESRVTIADGSIIWPAVISMNEPLRYGGLTFYQASTFIDQNNKPVSVLSVVTNKGWIFPYISGILLALGLIIHMFIRIKKI